MTLLKVMPTCSISSLCESVGWLTALSLSVLICTMDKSLYLTDLL